MLKRFVKTLGAAAIVLAAVFAWLWFSRPADLNFDDLRASVPFSEYSRFAEVDGLRVHYQEKGSGVPVVLLHGFASSTYTWKDVFEPLSQKYRVIAVDLKGFGFSAKPDGDYTRRGQGQLVAHLLDRLNIEKAWICGNSMGGEIAVNVALQFPERVKGLVLIDSGGINVAGAASLVPGYLKVPVISSALTAVIMVSDRMVKRGLELSFYNDSLVTPDRIAYYHRPLKTRDGQLAAIRARQQAGEFPVETQLDRINVPTLIIWGSDDEIVPVEAGQKFNSLINGSRLVIIDNCGHVPQEETPERVLREIVATIGT